MKKKLIISAIAVVLIALALISFKLITNNGGEKGKDIESIEMNKIEKELEASGKLSPVKLTFCFDTKDNIYLREVLNEIEKQAKTELNIQLNFKFNIRPYYFESLESKIKDFAYPWDVVVFKPDDINLCEMYKGGIFADISSLFPKFAPKYYSYFPAEDLKVGKVDDKLIAIPSQNTLLTTKAVIVKNDLMKKFNLTSIEDYKDLETYLSNAKKEDPRAYPFGFYNGSMELFAREYGYAILDKRLEFVYKWDDPNMKVMAWEQTPEYLETMAMLQKWAENGYFRKNDFILGGEYVATIDRVKRSGDDNYTGGNYHGYTLYKDNPEQRDAPCLVSAINAKSPNAERVFMFLEWLQTKKENYDLFMHGIEGKNYTLDESENEIPIGGDNAYENWLGKEAFFNTENQFNGNEKIKQKFLDKMLRKSKYPPHIGFVPDYGPVANIANYRRDTASDDDRQLSHSPNAKSIQVYIESQKSKGIDDVVALVQSQLDAWRAANK